MPDDAKDLMPQREVRGDSSEAESSRARAGWVEWSIGVLNGVVGDYLHQRNNGLAVQMAFVHRNRALDMSRQSLGRAFPDATSKLCVLIHGLTCTESCWSFRGDPKTSFGSLLQEDLGYTPVFLRYNTGLHISENGELLSHRLQELVSNYPRELDELIVIGHSMGGLLLRSACHQAPGLGHDWTRHLRHAFYLGTPHFGTRFEKFGNVVSWMLRTVPNDYTRLASDVINLRSRGIKDLRYTNLAHEDWRGTDPDALLQDNRHPVPLMPGVSHYFVGGTLTSNERHVAALLFGDLLVQACDSVPLGAQDRPLVFPPENGRLFPGIAHLALAYHPEVYAQLKTWLGQEPGSLERNVP